MPIRQVRPLPEEQPWYISGVASHGATTTDRCAGDARGGWLYWVTVGLVRRSPLVLVVAYIVLVQDNRAVQAEVNRRQQFINQSIQLGRVNEALIRALAAAAANNKDDKLRDLLAQNGITINAAGEPSQPSAPADKTRRRRQGAVTMSPVRRTSREAGAWWLPVALVVVSFFVLMAFETGYAIHDREALG